MPPQLTIFDHGLAAFDMHLIWWCNLSAVMLLQKQRLIPVRLANSPARPSSSSPAELGCCCFFRISASLCYSLFRPVALYSAVCRAFFEGGSLLEKCFCRLRTCLFSWLRPEPTVHLSHATVIIHTTGVHPFWHRLLSVFVLYQLHPQPRVRERRLPPNHTSLFTSWYRTRFLWDSIRPTPPSTSRVFSPGHFPLPVIPSLLFALKKQPGATRLDRAFCFFKNKQRRRAWPSSAHVSATSLPSTFVCA